MLRYVITCIILFVLITCILIRSFKLKKSNLFYTCIVGLGLLFIFTFVLERKIDYIQTSENVRVMTSLKQGMVCDDINAKGDIEKYLHKIACDEDYVDIIMIKNGLDDHSIKSFSVSENKRFKNDYTVNMEYYVEGWLYELLNINYKTTFSIDTDTGEVIDYGI